MRALLVASTVLLMLQNATANELRVRAPRTSSAIMIDGEFSDGDWKNAARVDVPGVAQLYFQRSSEFVYIAVEYTHAVSGIVDLYVSPLEGEIYDLHASAKLGERQLHDRGFPDWTWWNNRGWIANVSRVDSFEKKTFLPARIREYQIRRSRFSSSVWRLRFELTTLGAEGETQSAIIFPPSTAAKSTDGWLLLSLR
jgi:hypothetical protein